MILRPPSVENWRKHNNAAAEKERSQKVEDLLGEKADFM